MIGGRTEVAARLMNVRLWPEADVHLVWSRMTPTDPMLPLAFTSDESGT